MQELLCTTSIFWNNENCTLYTIQFLSEDDTEFEHFFNKFKDDVEFSPDLMRIVGFLGKIADFGALERYFRPEGKMSDHVVALPTLQSKLRLYCLRLSDRILILGNGGVKNTKTYEESKKLCGYVLAFQKLRTPDKRRCKRRHNHCV